VRSLRLSLFAASLVAASGLVFSPVAGADDAPALRVLTPSPAPVSPGSEFQVQGRNCPPRSTVFVGMLDASGEIDIDNGSTAGSQEEWSVDLQVPKEGRFSRPGTYPVVANCADYNGYDGYNGYNGYNGGGFTYTSSTVTVGPPSELPAFQPGLRVDPPRLRAGNDAKVTSEPNKFTAGEQVTLILYSSPVTLQAVTADARGAISTTIKIPEDTTLGEHTVIAMNAGSNSNPEVTLGAPITVISDSVDGGGAGTGPGGPGTGPGGPGTGPGGPGTGPGGPGTGPGGPGTGPGNPVQNPGNQASGSLPRTGTEPLTLIVAGLLLLLAGAFTTWRYRNRATVT
jgi:LPXTG-motif cell wall-anchored protein